MTLVVADSSPLHYLILLGQPDLLRHLFDSVVIPPAVAEELAQPNTPPRVREWIQNPPIWLSVDDRPLGPDLPRSIPARPMRSPSPSRWAPMPS